MAKINRIGETRLNNFGSKMTIIDYKGIYDITVQFEDGYIAKAKYSNFTKGEVKSLYEKRVFNNGYLGEGNYTVHNKDGKLESSYIRWRGILERCYDPKYHNIYSTYIGCSVCEEWLCYQTFAKWHEENFYQVENENMALDKDILVKGNKIYSSETCCFVPERINGLFTKSNKTRGNYPIGVSFDTHHKVFSAYCQNGEKQIKLGDFRTPETAFDIYKNFKEKIIKEVAEKYKNKIPEKLYLAMLNYKVEITD